MNEVTEYSLFASILLTNNDDDSMSHCRPAHSHTIRKETSNWYTYNQTRGTEKNYLVRIEPTCMN